MAGQKGHTLLEVVLVIVVIGALAAVVVPNIFVSIEQTKAQSARNNLLAIAAAQSKYDEDYGTYCVGACADNTTDIDKNLKLVISPSDSFSYICSGGSLACPVYQCTAQDQSDKLTLCVTNTGSGPHANVSCVGPSNSYCPA